MAKVLTTTTPAEFERAVRAAADALRAGAVVALPTETVYGLAANALDPSAVEKIFAIKGRPAHNPIIVHVASLAMARTCTAAWPAVANKLAESFWPGPLTLVLPKAKAIPAVVTAGGDTVGVRWPNHPVVQAVIRRCGFPLAAPSANLAGQVSPTRAEHVSRSLGRRIELIIDAGPTEVGLESTVLDLTGTPPRLLRPGMIDADALAAVAGSIARHETGAGEPLRSPGLLSKHYAPRARLLVWEGGPQDLSALVSHQGVPLDRIHLLARGNVRTPAPFGRVCILPDEPQAFAKALYAELHRSDEAGAELILVQAVPRTAKWQGVADRLQRASA